MSIDEQEPGTAIATTRRQFTGLICGSGLLALPGCGGGGSGSPEVPPVPPVPPVTPAAPQITLQPRSVGVTVGQSVTFEVQATGSNLVYQWLRGGVAIAGATASTLVLVTQTGDSEARFSVRVSNEGGTVTSAEAVLTLTVPLVAPQITLQPQSVNVGLGQALTLLVEVSGLNLVYQWRRNGVAVAGATASSLVISVASTDSGAQYTVVVSNAAGQVESQAAVLTLIPVIVPGISLLAGGLGGSSLLEGRGTQARIMQPDHVAVSKDGTVYFSCGILYGKVSAQGDVSFIGNFPSYMTIGGMACDSHGDLYVCHAGLSVIYKLVNGTFLVFADALDPYPSAEFQDLMGHEALLKLPSSPAFDAQDNLYFIIRRNHAIRKVTPNGVVSTVAGASANLTMLDGKGSAAGFEAPSSLLAFQDGSLLVLDGTRWRKVMPDGTVSTLPGTLPPAVGAVVGVNASLLYALLGNSVVKLALDGSSVNVAGSQVESGYVDGLNDAARFNAPTRLALSVDGQLFVADQLNSMLRRVDPASGQVTSWVGAAPKPGHVDGTGAQARFADMGASCLDRDGNVYVIDTRAKTLRKVTPAGVTSTLFPDFPSEGGVAVDAGGNFYGVRKRAIIKVSPTGAQQVWAGQTGVLGYADGAGTAASFAWPKGLVVDAQGNLLVGDSPEITPTELLSFDYLYTYGGTIRKITPEAVVSTVAGVPGRVFRYGFLTTTFPTPDSTFVWPTALACDAKGTLWVLDAWGIRRIDSQGAAPVWVLRDNSYRSVPRDPFGAQPSTIAYAVGSQGDVYLSQGNVIRKVSADGTQSVVAGVDNPDRNGVRLGALPGRLGQVGSIMAGAGNMLYCCCENSVLRIQF